VSSDEGPRTFTVQASDLDRCPVRSWQPSHYRDDGSCACVPPGAPKVVGPDSPAIRANLAELGRRAAGNACDDVLVAPDHTQRLNYHTCGHGKPHKAEAHYCGCGYVWDTGGQPRNDPFTNTV
jgi:hypothetical protein